MNLRYPKHVHTPHSSSSGAASSARPAAGLSCQPLPPCQGVPGAHHWQCQFGTCHVWSLAALHQCPLALAVDTVNHGGHGTASSHWHCHWQSLHSPRARCLHGAFLQLPCTCTCTCCSQFVPELQLNRRSYVVLYRCTQTIPSTLQRQLQACTATTVMYIL